MPHVIVKIWPGKTEEQKTQLAGAIAKEIVEILHYRESAISVAIEEVSPHDWAEKVFKPDIRANPNNLYKKPGYDLPD